MGRKRDTFSAMSVLMRMDSKSPSHKLVVLWNDKFIEYMHYYVILSTMVRPLIHRTFTRSNVEHYFIKERYFHLLLSKKFQLLSLDLSVVRTSSEVSFWSLSLRAGLIP